MVEQGFALLHWFRRMRIRWEIRDDINEASAPDTQNLHVLRDQHPYRQRTAFP